MITFVLVVTISPGEAFSGALLAAHPGCEGRRCWKVFTHFVPEENNKSHKLSTIRFDNVVKKFAAQFQADFTYSLIVRLHHNVVKTAVITIMLGTGMTWMKVKV